MTLRAGDRVELVEMPDDPSPIARGSRGRVLGVSRLQLGDSTYDQVIVDWDNGRRLHCCVPPDVLAIVRDE
jgi:hypothetical protein